jgi:hypothetical protein
MRLPNENLPDAFYMVVHKTKKQPGAPLSARYSAELAREKLD